jgi:hypothetical protein
MLLNSMELHFFNISASFTFALKIQYNISSQSKWSRLYILHGLFVSMKTSSTFYAKILHNVVAITDSNRNLTCLQPWFLNFTSAFSITFFYSCLIIPELCIMIQYNEKLSDAFSLLFHFYFTCRLTLRRIPRTSD